MGAMTREEQSLVLMLGQLQGTVSSLQDRLDALTQSMTSQDNIDDNLKLELQDLGHRIDTVEGRLEQLEQSLAPATAHTQTQEAVGRDGGIRPLELLLLLRNPRAMLIGAVSGLLALLLGQAPDALRDQVPDVLRDQVPSSRGDRG
ncbi:MAG: hypothetical protein ERJ68_00150 [Aphanocapsa feldmannii 277cI]|uniref:Uncharacterized protein n=1 Tax=Aphanocapsa feldmannii 277cI TaxID=2507554 RepID=A0A524RW13_9CHRO|nr:MAG: hypothetical protein ERJ68_00150 [Aphanocapsa feldmannii 277cI]